MVNLRHWKNRVEIFEDRKGSDNTIYLRECLVEYVHREENTNVDTLSQFAFSDNEV